MRGKIAIVLMMIATVSCGKEDFKGDPALDYVYGRDLKHDMIVLGDRLENPYTTANMTKALNSLYPVKSDRTDLKTTDLYVRFLPADDAEYELLHSLGIHLTDHPMDYDIVVEGDWYHDPDVPENKVTWQYAVVPADFDFPDIRYELIDECFIAENAAGTRADGIDWAEVERMAYKMTGNESRLAPVVTKASSKVQPSGRITIEDADFKGGQPFGVAGVQVSCNSFVKFDHAYTDRDGYYQMEKTYASDLRYRLVFKNEKGFSIGFNMILVPASVSTLGQSSPEGVNMTVTANSDEKLFRRCAVNNAAYDYISRCESEDLDINVPPGDLRIWILNFLDASSAVMLHHGAIVRNDLIRAYLQEYAGLLEAFLPDITIGSKSMKDYADLYSTTTHELSHASHFSKVGTGYWNNYILYIIESFLSSRDMMYGDGTGVGAGYCEIGEMWAYYVESKLYKERYGGTYPSFGTGYWFYPQIFRFLEERGMTTSDIFSVLTAEVVSKPELKSALTLAFPEQREMIEQVFNRY